MTDVGESPVEGEFASGSGSGSDENHFTDEQLDLMLYEWDEDAHPVVEYHVWSDPEAEDPEVNRKDEGDEKSGVAHMSLEDVAVDDGNRSIVDLKRYTPGKAEKLVYLDLDTSEVANVVEFYAPWCPHCQNYKSKYVSLAREVERRSIGVPVRFLAVSCELYVDLCRTYGLHGFPVVLGYPVGSDPAEYGEELNAVDRPLLTADSLAEAMDLDLAHEARSFWTSSYSDSEEQRKHVERTEKAETDAAERKREWHEFGRDLGTNDRLQNAALSLAFALRSGVYVDYGELDVKRKSALSDFVDLVDWASPPTWSVRTGLVRELRRDIEQGGPAVMGRDGLVALVDRAQEEHEKRWEDAAADHLWGYVDATGGKTRRGKARKRKTVTGLGGDVPDARNKALVETDIEDIRSKNRRWTESCTHGRPAMGFTCGLWDLFHILTLGSSFPEHQLYGFHMGYLTSPQDVATAIRNFIANFFPCDVCRWNFLDMYDGCGHGRCRRLSSGMPAYYGVGGGVGKGDWVGRELALWLWEVHNAVNVRLMKEAAERENRVVSEKEREVGKWPTRDMCEECWIGEKMERYDRDVLFDFLLSWYWPFVEDRETNFDAVLNRRVTRIHHRTSRAMLSGWPSSLFFLPIVIACAAVGWKFHNHSGHSRKKFVDSRYSPGRLSRHSFRPRS